MRAVLAWTLVTWALCRHIDGEETRCPDEWFAWAVGCYNCNNLGEGTTRRFRICEGGEPQWDELGCSTDCNKCMKPVKVNTAPCLCRQDSALGVAMVTYRCLHLGENVTYLRQTPGPCGCEGCRSAPCKNGAICADVDGVRYTCQCPPLFTGEHCETPIGCVDDDSCYNGGRCVGSASSYHCACPFLLTGAQCLEVYPCGGWLHYGCEACGYRYLLSSCGYNDTAHAVAFNLKLPKTDHELRSLSQNVVMLLNMQILAPDTGDAQCTWSEWSPCQFIFFGVACGKLRRKYCPIGGVWLPVDIEMERNCECDKLALISRGQWSQWTSAGRCWPSSCRQFSFQTRKRNDLLLLNNVHAAVTDLRPCPPSDGSACDQEMTTDTTTTGKTTKTTTANITTTEMTTVKTTTTPRVVPLSDRSGSVCPVVHTRGTYLLLYCVGLGLLVASLVNA